MRWPEQCECPRSPSFTGRLVLRLSRLATTAHSTAAPSSASVRRNVNHVTASPAPKQPQSASSPRSRIDPCPTVKIRNRTAAKTDAPRVSTPHTSATPSVTSNAGKVAANQTADVGPSV